MWMDVMWKGKWYRVVMGQMSESCKVLRHPVNPAGICGPGCCCPCHPDKWYDHPEIPGGFLFNGKRIPPLEFMRLHRKGPIDESLKPFIAVLDI